MTKCNVVLSVDKSEVLKAYCRQEGIKFFRTEYGEDRYCEVEVTDEQRREIDEFLETLHDVINTRRSTIAIFKHDEDDFSMVDFINEDSIRGSYGEVMREVTERC